MKELMEDLFGKPLIPMLLLSAVTLAALIMVLWFVYNTQKQKNLRRQRFTRMESRRLHNRNKE